MTKSSVGAHAPLAGLFLVLCSCWASGCEEHGGYYGYRHGPAYGPAAWAGAIRFEWSLPGTPRADRSDDDAGALDADAGIEADAGASNAASERACKALGASELQALLFDQDTIVGAFQLRCSAGSGEFRVRSNDYTMTAALVTEDGVPVTKTEAIPSFVLAPGETQLVRIAFEKLASD